MGEANAYNQTKSALDSEIAAAMEQYEIDNSAISASQKRIERITTRIPELKMELESIDNARNDIDTQIQKIKESIQETNEKKNNIGKELELVDSQRQKVLSEQSEAAAKKSEIDEKIQTLKCTTK